MKVVVIEEKVFEDLLSSILNSNRQCNSVEFIVS